MLSCKTIDSALKVTCVTAPLVSIQFPSIQNPYFCMEISLPHFPSTYGEFDMLRSPPCARWCGEGEQILVMMRAVLLECCGIHTRAIFPGRSGHGPIVHWQMLGVLLCLPEVGHPVLDCRVPPSFC